MVDDDLECFAVGRDDHATGRAENFTGPMVGLAVFSESGDERLAVAMVDNPSERNPP
jgi:hypothetical protein